MEKVSIIITAYRRQEFVKNLLHSLLQNTNHPNYEVIVVNTDPTYNKNLNVFLEQQKNNPKLKIVTPDKQLQYMQGNEEGYLVSDGDYIQLLNDDTLIPQNQGDWLSNLQQYLINNQDVKSVACYQFLGNMKLYTKGELDINKPGHTHGSKGEINDLPKELETVWNPFSCVMFPRSFIEKNRFLDVVPEPQYHYGSDSCYCRKILDLNYKNVTINKNWIFHFNNRNFRGKIYNYLYKGI